MVGTFEDLRRIDAKNKAKRERCGPELWRRYRRRRAKDSQESIDGVIKTKKHDEDDQELRGPAEHQGNRVR